MFQALVGDGGGVVGSGDGVSMSVSLHSPVQKHGVFAWAGVRGAERDGMSVFSNMESVALFCK